jgi:hypothetical protein
MDANLGLPFDQNSIYEHFLIALQLAHNTNTTRIAYNDDSYTWSI